MEALKMQKPYFEDYLGFTDYTAMLEDSTNVAFTLKQNKDDSNTYESIKKSLAKIIASNNKHMQFFQRIKTINIKELSKQIEKDFPGYQFDIEYYIFANSTFSKTTTKLKTNHKNSHYKNKKQRNPLFFLRNFNPLGIRTRVVAKKTNS